MKINITLKTLIVFLFTYALSASSIAQNPISKLVENYGPIEWNNNYFHELSYDDNDNLILDLQMQWSASDEQFEDFSNIINTYDESTGAILTSTTQIWYGTTTGWVDWIMDVYNYDENDLLESKLSQMWMTSELEWVTQHLETYSYDVENKIESLELGAWSTILEDYYPIKQILYTYDSDLNSISALNHSWLEEWIPNELFVTVLNSNDDIETVTRSNVFDGIFINSSIDYYTYNTDQNLMTILSAFWFDDGQEWLDGYQKLYTYNTNESMHQETLQVWNTGTTEWSNGQRTTYNYAPDGLESLNNPDFLIYPNPTNEELYFSGLPFQTYDINIFDMAGRLVLSSTSQNDLNFVSLTDLNSGIYSIQILSNNKELLRKFLKY